MKKWLIFLVVWSLLGVTGGFAQQVVSISVNDGIVKRYPNRFYPTMTVVYSTGRVEKIAPPYPTRISVSDDKKNTTLYAYDNLNRPTVTTFADGTMTQVIYNRDSQPIRFIDNNGTVVSNTFDALGRLTHKAIAPAQGIMGTTCQTFEYDGLSRLTRATDNNDPANLEDDSMVERKYDSLGRILEETQNGLPVSYNWTQFADPVDLTYPNGRRIAYTLDVLNRLTSIANDGGASIATYDYLGSRVIERSYANGVKLTMLNDAGTATEGYDALGRLTKMRHLQGNTLASGYDYGYNRENMKTYADNLAHPQLREKYPYSFQAANFLV